MSETMLSLEDAVKKHVNDIFAVAVGVSGNQEDAEDITQAVLWKLAGHLRRAKRRGKIGDWVFKTAYRQALDFEKRKYRQISTFQGSPGSAGRLSDWLFVNRLKNPEEQLLDDDLGEQIAAAVNTMPIRYRMPLLLRGARGFPVRETANILGISAGTVESRLRKAYHTLAAKMHDYANDRSGSAGGSQPNLACPVWTKLIADYEERKLDDKNSRDFKKHLKDCPGCQSFLDSYKRAIRLTGSLECRDIEPALREKIETFLLSHKKALADLRKGSKNENEI